MSYGERSCVHYGPGDGCCPEGDLTYKCNVDCPIYESNGKNPDSIPMNKLHEKEVAEAMEKHKHMEAIRDSKKRTKALIMANKRQLKLKRQARKRAIKNRSK